MFGFGEKGKWFGVEGGIKCKRCDSDFCGVSGKDTLPGSNRTLTSASKQSSTATTSNQSTANKKEIIAKGKLDFKEDSKPKETFKLTIPANKLIEPCSYALINIGEGILPNSPYFIETVDYKDEEDLMDLSIKNYVPFPSEEYTPPNEKASGDGSGEVKVSGKARGETEKWLINKGAELRTANKIFAFIRKNGSHGMKYPSIYYNHIKGGDTFKFHEASAKYCLKVKKANCCDFSWLFWAMCKGAGIKCLVCHGQATFGSKTYGHLWNEVNGKRYDCSSTNGKNYKLNKKISNG